MATSKISAKDEASPGSILLVIHNFVARSADELSLAKGDRIELIERDDDFGDGWFLGRHMTNNQTGLFPQVYTTPAPKGTFANSAQNRRASDGPQKIAGGGGGSGGAGAIAAATSAQQRHLSASAVTSARPNTAATSSQTSVSASPHNLRTSIASSTSSLGSKTGAMHTDSPVMNETLSVIDEHMNDMQAPRPPFANGKQRDTIASSVGSVYSSQPLDRYSYIAGHETDEEEDALHSESEVLAWSAERVAEYLEDHGVEKLHCDVFREQEITGEVLLAMDQSSLFIKEFDLGPVGRRLKTWHKIKALQDEVRQAGSSHTISEEPARGSLYSATTADESNDAGRTRSSTMGSVLPRALSTTSRSAESPVRSSTTGPGVSQPSASPIANRPPGMSPLQSMTTMPRMEQPAPAQQQQPPYRPSAQTIRAMQHSRRHSSIDSTTNSIDSSSRTSHRKQPSLDQKWQPGQALRSAAGNRPSHSHALSTDSILQKRESTSALLSASPVELLDRGYISSTELGDTSQSSTTTSKITKVRSASATRASRSSASAAIDNSERRTSQVMAAKTLRDSPNTAPRPVSGDGVWGAMNAVGSKLAGGMRSATAPALPSPPPPPPGAATTSDGTSPVVTKLDYDDATTVSSTAEESNKTSSSSPTTHKFNFFSNQRARITGLRAISDNNTTNNNNASSRDEKPTSPDKMDSPARAGVATPSTDTTSLDLQKSEAQSRTSQGSASNLVSYPHATSTSTNVIRRPRARTKTKKATSAYTRGLEQKSPAEQMQNCDYSGWMKKKSGSLMATWKTRLFILRGRRLSYYYAENDTEEKGLIDISFHRVLPAQNETLTGIHATLTGATSNPVSPKEGTGGSGGASPGGGRMLETAAQHDLKQPPRGFSSSSAVDAADDNDGAFIFKLVPPKTGLSKGVNFTRPTVHYFAVNSRREGRLWMAALMKATIDRDDESVVTTTYNQATISLKQARARKERPPALKDSGDEADDGGGDDGTPDGGEKGLDGLNENGNTTAQQNDQQQQGLGIGIPSTGGLATPAADDTSPIGPAVLAASTAVGIDPASATGPIGVASSSDVTEEQQQQQGHVLGAEGDEGNGLFSADTTTTMSSAATDAADAEADRMVWLEKERELTS